jgi:hypothetical protein
MSAITSSNAASAIVKLVAAQALAPIVGNLVFGRLVNRDFEPTLAQFGDAVNVPIPPVMSANNILESGTVQTQNPNLGNAQVVLNTHAECSFQIPDVTKILAVPDLLKTYLEPSVIAIVESIEQSVANLYSNMTYNTAVGAASTVDESRIDSAESALFAAKVPPTQQKYLVVNTNTFGAMRQLSRFTEFQTAGWAAGGPGGVNGIQTADMAGAGPMGANGKVKDFLVFRSQFINKVSGTTYNMAFARDGIFLAIRRLPMPIPGTGAIAQYAEMGNFGVRVVMSYAPNSLAQQFTVDCFYGCAIGRNNFTVQVQTNN